MNKKINLSQWRGYIPYVLLGIMILLGVWARAYQFGSIPAWLNQDEATSGYDAFSILHFGVDRHGVSMPIQLTAWGSGQSPLYAYLSIPFVGVFGLNVVSLRLVNLLFGLVALPICYLLSMQLSGKKELSLAITGLLAISPAPIMGSRWGHEAYLFPWVVLCGAYFLARYFKQGAPFFGFAAIFFIAMSMYAYGTAYYFTPIFLAIIFSYAFVLKKIKWQWILIYGLFFFILIFPILIYILINQFGLEPVKILGFTAPRLTSPPRQNDVLIPIDINFLKNFISNFFNINQILFTQQDWIWNSIPGFGMIYLISLPFWLLGILLSLLRLLKAFKKHVFDLQIVMISWMIAAFVLGFLIYVNINRWSIVIFPLIYFSGIGILEVVHYHKSLKVLIYASYLIYFCLFSFQYFNHYNELVGIPFNESLNEAIDYARQLPVEKIILTGSINSPGVLTVTYLQYPTDSFLNTVTYVDNEEYQISSFGKYQFNLPQEIDPHYNYAYIVLNDETGLFSETQFNFHQFKRFSVVYPK